MLLEGFRYPSVDLKFHRNYQERSQLSEKRTNTYNSFLKILDRLLKERTLKEQKLLEKKIKIRNSFLLS